jgi:hypothetical protein
MRGRLKVRRVVVLCVLAATLGATAATSASADTVTGEALVGQGFFRTFVSVDAHSGPSGEAPNGSVVINICPLGPCTTRASSLGGTVTCMNVQDNRAIIGIYGTAVDVAFSGIVRLRGFLEVVDNGSPGVGRDTLAHESHNVEILFNPSADVPLTSCPASITPGLVLPTGPLPLAPDASDPDWGRFSGLRQDFVVVDTKPLPTSTDQCKNGGWRTYGVFKNQGDCVSYVATKGKSPPANTP